MSTLKSLENRIRGWIPKDPVLVNRTIIVFIAVLAALIIPIYYLVLQATAFFGALWIIIYVAAVLAVRYIIHKTGFPMPSPRAQRIQATVRRIRIIIASGLVTAFGISFAARLITGPLPTYFWIPFIILIAMGAFIGDSLWKTLQKHDLGGISK